MTVVSRGIAYARIGPGEGANRANINNCSVRVQKGRKNTVCTMGLKI
jgi:hypothetical protein